VNAHYVGQVGDATVYTTAKNAVAAALLIGVLGAGALRRRPDAARQPLTRRQWGGLMILGVVGGSVQFVLFFEGLARASSPVTAGFIHKTLVVWVALLAVPLLRERLTVLHGAAIALLIAGQLALLGSVGALQLGAAEAMVFGATLLWAVEFVIAKRLLRSVGSTAVGAARLGIGIAFLSAYVVATGRAGLLVGLSAQVWIWALVTGVILAGFVGTWYAALARAQAVDVTAVLVFGQVITAALSSSVVGAPLRPDLLGLALILVGVGAATAGALRARVPALAS
jgi:drug/metabolite transporter (DMT)-like permease